MDELDVIDRFVRDPQVQLPEGWLGPGDDAALLLHGAQDGLVVSTDQLTEMTHFLPSADPAAVGRFLVHVAASDLAAMGADPLAFLVALTQPAMTDQDWTEGVARGVRAGCAELGLPLVGGDSKQGATRVLTGTALGTVEPTKALRRSGAQVGDLVVVTGPLGAQGAALAAHNEGRLDGAGFSAVMMDVRAHMEEGALLRDGGATAAVDLSDGVARAACLVAEASGVTLRLDEAALPVHAVVGGLVDLGDPEVRRSALLDVGGEYALLATVPEARLDASLKRFATAGRRLHTVGRVEATEATEASLSPAVLATEEGPALNLEGRGWRHFRTSG